MTSQFKRSHVQYHTGGVGLSTPTVGQSRSLGCEIRCKNSIIPLLFTPAQPVHHLHSDNEPLLSTKGAAATNDYATSTKRVPALSTLRDEEESRHIADAAPPHVHGKSVFNSERPLDVKPITAGGVAIGGRSDLPMGHAGLGDKMIGKTQKVV